MRKEQIFISLLTGRKYNLMLCGTLMGINLTSSSSPGFFCSGGAWDGFLWGAQKILESINHSFNLNAPDYRWKFGHLHGLVGLEASKHIKIRKTSRETTNKKSALKETKGSVQGVGIPKWVSCGSVLSLFLNLGYVLEVWSPRLSVSETGIVSNSSSQYW